MNDEPIKLPGSLACDVFGSMTRDEIIADIEAAVKHFETDFTPLEDIQKLMSDTIAKCVAEVAAEMFKPDPMKQAKKAARCIPYRNKRWS